MQRGGWIRAAVLLAVVALGLAGTARAAPFVYVLGRKTGTPRINVLTVIDAATNTKGTQITLGTLSASSFRALSTLPFDLDATLLRNDIVVPSPHGRFVYVPQFSSISLGEAVSVPIPFAAATDGIPNVIVATPPARPDPPANLRAAVNGNSVTLSWDASPSGPVAYLLEGGVSPGTVLASIPTGQNTP